MSQKRVTALVSGIQGGKTFLGRLWMRIQISKFLEKDDCFLITAPDYKIMQQATLPGFLDLMKGMGRFHKQDSKFVLNDGRIVWVRSLHEPDSIEGIAGCRAIWGDEAGKYSSKAWVNLQGRAAPKQAQIFLTTTPYALNWLYKELYKPWRDGHRPDVELVQFRSVDNPYFPREEFENQKRLLNERVFAMKYEGKFEKMAGLVFLDFEEYTNCCTYNTCPAYRDKQVHIDHDRFFVYAGIDWGFTNLFAISVRILNLKDGTDYQIDEFGQSFLDPVEKLGIAKQFQKKYGIEEFYCDNEEPATISMFNKAGLTALAAPKYPGSLNDNILRHNALIKSRAHKVLASKCTQTLDEYSTYHYPEDEGKEENIKENPVDAHNHFMTANMYATQMIETRLEDIKKNREFKRTPTRLERLLDGEFSKERRNSVYEVIE